MIDDELNEKEENLEIAVNLGTKELSNTLDTNVYDIVQQIINENDSNKIQDLTQLFNLNQTKKNLLRTIQLNDLIDKVTEEAINRVTLYGDSISDRDLINYLNIAQSSLEKTQKSSTEQLQQPLIQINQQNNNMEVKLSKDSQQKILDVVNKVLALSNEQSTNYIIDTTEEEN